MKNSFNQGNEVDKDGNSLIIKKLAKSKKNI